MEFMKDKPDKCYDLAIVDPPYGIGNTNRFSRGKNHSIHKNFKWNNAIPDHEYFLELYRITQNQIIWGCNYFINSIKDPGRIVFNKMLTNWSKGKNLSECDLASQSFNRKIDYFEYRWSGNVQGNTINWNNSGNNGRIHPQQKPIEIYRWCLNKYAKPGNKILDTHGGSMSIAIACDMEGYDLDICEIDKEYFDAGVKRFNEYKRQLKIEYA
jgi:site-specific DNA-methyltransferase (adenine-specific)